MEETFLTVKVMLIYCIWCIKLCFTFMSSVPMTSVKEKNEA